jgi:hypothetical protein
MGIKDIRRASIKANKLERELMEVCEKIKSGLENITGLDSLEVGFLAGDGFGVCLDKNGNDLSTSLDLVLSIIEEKGTITEEELLDLASL